MKRILVTGTSRPWDGSALRTARMVGRTLAERGFRLVTGNATGVDAAAAEAFCSKLASQRESALGRYTQLALPFVRRGSFWPMRSFAAGESKVPLGSTHEWLEEATALCAAAVMVGGHAGRVRGALAGRGALGIAERFIEQGKPVFPIPFSGGDSDEVFQTVLSRWGESPVPGLSRDQFLRLALPWTSGTGAFGDLLHGTLAETPDVFISYRRDDVGWAGGRLYRDLSDHFGAERVFMDLQDIAPGDKWNDTIQNALECCRVGVVLVGNRWLGSRPTGATRLNEADDPVRGEIRALLEAEPGKRVIVVLAGVAPLAAEDLPEDLHRLVEMQAVPISNATWDVVVGQIIGTISRALRSAPS